MIINGPYLLSAGPIKNMALEKHRIHGTSYGLSEAGYDIRIKQDVWFRKWNSNMFHSNLLGDRVFWDTDDRFTAGRFMLASAIEEFDMPGDLTGIVHDKSTWARQGLGVFNTVIEPGWKGFLTLELVYHGEQDLLIPAGSGIAQVIFHENKHTSYYDGKYQNQQDQPVQAILD